MNFKEDRTRWFLVTLSEHQPKLDFLLQTMSTWPSGAVFHVGWVNPQRQLSHRLVHKENSLIIPLTHGRCTSVSYLLVSSAWTPTHGGSVDIERILFGFLFEVHNIIWVRLSEIQTQIRLFVCFVCNGRKDPHKVQLSYFVAYAYLLRGKSAELIFRAHLSGVDSQQDFSRRGLINLVSRICSCMGNPIQPSFARIILEINLT